MCERKYRFGKLGEKTNNLKKQGKEIKIWESEKGNLELGKWESNIDWEIGKESMKV